METVYKVLITVIIIIILIIIGIVLYLFLKPKKQKNISEESTNKPNNESISIDTYNNIYNMNYGYNKLFANSEILNMDSAMAIVINEPVTKTIIVNNTNIVIYVAKINFTMKNYTNIDAPKMEYKFGFLQPTNKLPPSKGIIKSGKDTDTTTKSMDVISDIVTTKPISKGDKFMVYYKFGSDDNDRILPPFLLEEYVTYLN